MSYNYDEGYNRYSKKQPKRNDVWLAKVPYIQDGNWYKTRPIWIREVKEDIVIARKITTQGDERFNYPIVIKNNKIQKQSYLSYEKIEIERYRLIRKIGTYEEV